VKSFKLILTSILLVLGLTAQSTTYYVSPSGNDSNNGTSQSTPWRTIARVNQSAYSYQPGDQILFRRGGVYYGEIYPGTSGTAQAPIVFADYGAGALPIISGCKEVTAWTQHQGNIWKASVPQKVYQVYNQNIRMIPARYPNTGWMRNTQGSGTSLQSNDITQPSGYWTGAKVTLRSTASSVDTLVVTNHVGSTLTFSTTPLNNNLGGDPWGFFFHGKLNQLDAAKEWFWDPATSLLYLWLPNNVNPNTTTVLASVYQSGVYCGWMRHHYVIRNLHLKNAYNAGVKVDGASNITVEGCTLDQCYHGIRSYGSFNLFTNNHIQNTYASGVLLIDHNTVFENNQLTNIANVIGEGESGWGYFGARIIGPDITVRGNRLDSIGYIGIGCGDNQLIERNVIHRANCTLNDGAGIALDNADGLTIQDNIILDFMTGLDGSATNLPHYQPLGVGIYFGNISIKNTTVQRNTVANSPGVGINVDHTMVSTGLVIRDNVMFNNQIQMSVSDYSNYNGPGATPPYYVPVYNDIYENNTLYCLADSQLCMRQFHCYGQTPVDFGTYSGNRYHNPYNELSLMVYNLNYGGRKYYTLERWQADRHEDLNSTRSTMRLNSYSTVAELTSNLTPSGLFNTNLGGWPNNLWPTNGILSWVNNQLDQGAMSVNLPNNNIYPTLSTRSPEIFSLQSQQWYRLGFSLISPNPGDMIIGIKGQSQLNNPYTLFERQVPFSPERRDLTLYFKAPITDQATVQIINQYTEPVYTIDNISVHKVDRQAINPLDKQILVINELPTVQVMPLDGGWMDLDQMLHVGSISVNPYSSVILIKVDTIPTNYLSIRTLLEGPLDWSTGLMRCDLSIPDTHPYTDWGNIKDAEAISIPLDSVVDWVLIQLVSPQDQILESHALLLKATGDIVDPRGTNMIQFINSVAGNRLAVRHRNHLGAMCNTPLTAGQMVDFSSPLTQLYGSNAVKTSSGRCALWAGDVNHDGRIKYTGTQNDRDLILVRVGGTPNQISVGYYDEDINLNGSVRYTGSGNDRDPILVNVGATTPNGVKVAQLPY